MESRNCELGKHTKESLIGAASGFVFGSAIWAHFYYIPNQREIDWVELSTNPRFRKGPVGARIVHDATLSMAKGLKVIPIITLTGGAFNLFSSMTGLFKSEDAVDRHEGTIIKEAAKLTK